MTHGLKAGEVARLSRVNVQTLRHYERVGLLDLPHRTHGNHRLYPAGTVERLRFIRKAQALGLALAEIRDILGTEQGKNRCVAAAQLLRGRLQAIDEALEMLQAQRQEIAQAVGSWTDEQRSSGDAKCLGRFCHVIEGCAEAAATPVPDAGPGPQVTAANARPLTCSDNGFIALSGSF